MKKIFSIIIPVIILFLNIHTATSQLKIVLGPSIGYTMPTGDYAGTTTDFYNGTAYGLNSGINFGAMGKLGLGPINFNLSIIYSPLSSSGTISPKGSVEIKQKILTIGIGSQYGFGIPLSPVKPYLGLDILFSTFNGSFNFSGGTPEVSDGTFDMQSASRTGLGIAGGVEIKLGGTLLDLSLRYNMLNLFSKSYEGLSNNDRKQSYMYLNDNKDPNFVSGDKKHIIGASRSITTVQLQVGILFGL